MHPILRSIINAFRSLFGYPPLIPTRILSASYTVELADELTLSYGLKCEDDLAKILAEQIRDEIDAEVLQDLYMTCMDVLQRIRFRYNRGGTYDVNHRFKRSRFNKLNGTRNNGFKPRPSRYLVY